MQLRYKQETIHLPHHQWDLALLQCNMWNPELGVTLAKNLVNFTGQSYLKCYFLFCECRGFPQVKTQRSSKNITQCDTQGHKGSEQSNKTVRTGLVYRQMQVCAHTHNTHTHLQCMYNDSHYSDRHSNCVTICSTFSLSMFIEVNLAYTYIHIYIHRWELSQL